jgi:hypothetical protein
MPFAEGTPTAEITLAGKSYTLGWTWGSKRRLKEWFTAHGVDGSSPTAVGENLPAVLWVSLDASDRDLLSVEDLEELLNPRNEMEVATKIGNLFKASEPEPDVKAVPVAVKGPTTGSSTSTNSEHLGSTISV